MWLLVLSSKPVACFAGQALLGQRVLIPLPVQVYAEFKAKSGNRHSNFYISNMEYFLHFAVLQTNKKLKH